jgi:DNA ligase (NAD+)
VNDGSVSSPADLYELEAKALAERERMGEKSAQNVIDAIARSRKTTLPRLLYALGIPQVGESTALALALQFGSIENSKRRRPHRSKRPRTSGRSLSGSVFDFFQDEDAKVGRRAAQASRHLRADQGRRTRESALAGLTMVITGTLAGSATRCGRGRAARTRRQGVGQCVEEDQFSRRRRGRGSKLAKAQSLGVRVLDEAALDRS